MGDTLNTILLSLGTTVITGAFQKANNPARAIDDLMTLTGFEKIHAWAEKNRIKQITDIEDFKQKLAKEIIEIAVENLKDPSLNILGPALEASKYYLDKETIRDMFARLIASDIDLSKENLVHPSFVEIIKQLSPLDAQNLSIIYNHEYENMPVANYYEKFKDTSKVKMLHPNVFVSNPDQTVLDFNSSSLENLRRMGLIDILYTQTKEPEFYELLNNNNYLEDIAKDLKKRHENFDSIFIEPGIIRLTFYGLDFCEVCLPQKRLLEPLH